MIDRSIDREEMHIDKYRNTEQYILFFICMYRYFLRFLGGKVVKNPPAKQKTQVFSLSQEDSLEKKMATHSSILAWEILRAEEPGRLQFLGLQRVRQTEILMTQILIAQKYILSILLVLFFWRT